MPQNSSHVWVAFGCYSNSHYIFCHCLRITPQTPIEATADGESGPAKLAVSSGMKNLLHLYKMCPPIRVVRKFTTLCIIYIVVILVLMHILGICSLWPCGHICGPSCTWLGHHACSFVHIVTIFMSFTHLSLLTYYLHITTVYTVRSLASASFYPIIIVKWSICMDLWGIACLVVR